MLIGETLSLIVAVSWTLTALFSETATRRFGVLHTNLIRLFLSALFLAILLWAMTGAPYPKHAGAQAWLWLAASGLVGFVFGDYCLFNAYRVMDSRFGQLFMTLSSVFAAFAAFALLGERLSWKAIAAMTVTLGGIMISILGKDSGKRSFQLRIPFKGVLFGLGAAIGQGVGLVLSKQGLLAYSADREGLAYNSYMIPFAGTMIRSVFGFLGFLAIMGLERKLAEIPGCLKDGKGMSIIMAVTFFGPFFGVSLSLMAVQYTSAGIAQTIMALTPVLILLPSKLYYHRKVRPVEVLGALISVAGTTLFFV